MNCQGGLASSEACYGDSLVRRGVTMSVKAGCLIYGKNGCGGRDFTFIDVVTGKNVKVSDKVVKHYGQSCPRKKCYGIFSCLWT